MSLYFSLPESEEISAGTVHDHTCSEGHVNRSAEWCRRMAEVCATAPYLSPEEKAVYLSHVAAIDARGAGKRDLFSQ